MIVSIPGEVICSNPWGRWEYVRDTETNDRRYLHVTCDVLTDDDGCCIMCGGLSPCATVARKLVAAYA